MRKIGTYQLWVGNAFDARDPRSLFDARIAAVVDLAANESVAAVPREIAYLRFPLTDGQGNPQWLLKASVDAVVGLLRANVSTLVSCGGGMSRSPCVVAAALAILTHKSPRESLTQVCEDAEADVSPAFWHEIQSAIQ